MKRTSITLFVLFVSIVSLAGNPVIIMSGNPKFIVSEASAATVTIDFTNAVVEEGETITEYLNRRGEDWVNDWSQVQQEVKEEFMEFFNEKNKKGIKLVDDNVTATYKMIIDVTAIDFGNTGGSVADVAMFGLHGYRKGDWGGASVTGYMHIVNTSTNEEICSIKINNALGQNSFTETSRLKRLFVVIAKVTLKVSKKWKGEII